MKAEVAIEEGRIGEKATSQANWPNDTFFPFYSYNSAAKILDYRF